MARFRKDLHPVNSEKHEITWTFLAQNASTIQTVDIAIGTARSGVNVANEVGIGSHLKSMYFEFHFSPQVITNPKVIHWQVTLQPFGTASSSPSTYFNTDKRFIMKRGMEMLPASTGTVFKRIFVLSSGMLRRLRIGSGDKLVFQYISSSTETINTCGIVIYKELY